MKRILLSTLVSAIVLFLWSGITQMFPWGISAVQNINVQSDKNTVQAQGPNMLHLQPNVLTRPEFDARFNNKISTYVTDDSVSWIVTQPVAESYTGYFVKEALTQLVVGFLMSVLFFLTTGLDFGKRMGIVGLSGLAAGVATYGQLMNWWGIPPSYGLGVIFNLIVGWMLAAHISMRFILKPTKNQGV